MHEIPGVARIMYNNVDFTTDGYGVSTERLRTASVEDAQLVSSEVGEGMHCPVLDIDMPAHLVPSSTLDHFHLYIDHPIPWWKYKILLRVMAWVGILEKGYVRASIARGFTAVRVPWLKKELF